MTGGSILITRAPKSLITVAAAGPAMKLAQSTTRRSLNSPPGMASSDLRPWALACFCAGRITVGSGRDVFDPPPRQASPKQVREARMASVILSVVGSDRPGLTQALAD